ncbi:Cyclin-I [Fasciolopsis buskii]|uniref:Cyclin-I n=1 Tax=Fasciolopsis buskii TaxID=27845 RepID=A0A8E0S8V3_9TREM|nr:Cyclin-I [Fasciolopsis buski]
MMVTGTRGVVRVLGATEGNIPTALITSVKNSKKSRRNRKRAENRDHPKRSDLVQSNFPSPLRTSCDNPPAALYSEPKFIPQGAAPIYHDYDHERLPTRIILHEKLYSLLTQESLLHVDVSHLLSVNAEVDDKLDAPLRRETLSKLWCLHSAFYGLSNSIFCKAVCLMDSFISRVKVKPKYAMCVSAACYYIASKFERSQDVLLPTPDSLVTLSRCGGTSSDLTRMVEIILSKLSPANVAAIGACPATACEFLRTFIAFSLWCSGSSSLLDTVNTANLPSLSNLIRQLEVSLTSAEAASFRPSCLALALLSFYCLPASSHGETSSIGLDSELHFTVPDLFNLAQVCGIHWSEVDACRLAISNAIVFPRDLSEIQDYPASRLLGSSPPLVWTLSRRTQRIMSNSQAPALPTILESEEQVDEVQSTLKNLELPAFDSIQETCVSQCF